LGFRFLVFGFIQGINLILKKQTNMGALRDDGDLKDIGGTTLGLDVT
jgi:hypothetical protein